MRTVREADPHNPGSRVPIGYLPYQTSTGLKKFQSRFIFYAETLSLQNPPRMV